MKSKTNWKRSDCAKLIKVYSKYPVLYNKAHPNYTSQKERENALINIAGQLQDVRPGTLVQEVKNRITNLRTQYLREKNRIQEAIDRGKEPVVKMWCFIDLQFLEDETKLDDPLETANVGDSTWFPDVDDDDSFSKSDYNAGEIEGERSNASVACELLDGSQKSLIVLEDLSENMDCEEEVLMENQCHASDESATSIIMARNPYNATEKLTNSNKRKNQSTFEVSRDSRNSFTNTSYEPQSQKTIHIIPNSTGSIESKLDKINERAAKVNKLIGNLPMEEKAHNRAFVENLIHDLDGLPDDVQQRVKWLITNEVYTAFHNAKKMK